MKCLFCGSEPEKQPEKGNQESQRTNGISAMIVHGLILWHKNWSEDLQVFGNILSCSEERTQNKVEWKMADLLHCGTQTNSLYTPSPKCFGIMRGGVGGGTV